MYSSFSGNVRPLNANNSVKVTLECVRPGVNLRFPTRELKLTLDNPSVTVGRASKNSSKNLQADTDNAFFDCAVMSREHARIYLSDGLQGPVMIRDIKSLHGTYVNNSERITDGVALQTGNTLKFGDQIARMQDLHHGVEVRVSLSRPPSSFAFSDNTMSAQSTLPSAPAKVTSFSVPDASDDDISNQGCIDEDEDEVTPSDDDEDKMSAHSITLMDTFPPSKSLAEDEKRRISGLSQLDPVVIDDEDISEPIKTTSPAGSPPRRFSDAQRDEFPDFNSEDENSEVEYAALDDDAVPSPPLSDDDGDDESVVSGRSCARAPFSRRANLWSSARSDGEVSEDDEDDAADSGCDASPEKATTAATSAAPIMHKIFAPSSDVSFKHTSAGQTSQFPNTRTLPNPETLASTSKMQIKDILAPVSGFTGISRFDIPPPTVPTNAGWPQNLSNYGSFADAGQTALSNTGYIQFGAGPEVDGGLDTQVESFGAGPFDAEPSTMAGVQEAYAQETAPSTVDVESKKRKRGEDEDENEDRMREDENGEGLLDASNSVKVAEEVDEGANSASTSQLFNHQTTEDALKQSGLCKLSLRPTLLKQMADEQKAKKDKKAKECRKVKKRDDTRPTKRARTSNVSLALTAAAGAVGGCVATVSFLWSPLAERLLA